MMHKWSINVTPAERIARVMIGLAGVVGGAYVLMGGATAVTAVLDVLLILAGLDLVVTGATGHCPLYQKLGYVPASLKGGTS
ncbi:YgaP family membrane protein [Rhodococcus ruber]